jgi:serine/threonine-protein kinase HipA
VPGLDVQLFFERVVLDFLIGNGDAHFQNFSMTYKSEGIRLAPAYDLVCTKLVIPTEEDSALTLQGKRNNITRNDVDAFADYLEIPQKVRYQKFTDKPGRMKQLIEASRLPADSREKFAEIVASRFRRLKLDS